MELRRFFRIVFPFGDVDAIVEDAYYLSKLGRFSFHDTLEMSYYERQKMLKLCLEDLKKENAAYKKAGLLK